MSENQDPIVIKKYANRRLYNTGSSTYVTLEDLASMVKDGEDFVVQDAKSGDDLTRSVLTQIIFEQEGKEGQNLLPVAFLRQLISYYGDSMQTVIPSYLEMTMNSFAKEQDKLRDQMTKAIGTVGVPNMTMPGMDMSAVEDQVKQNTEMFQNAMRMFLPFAADRGSDQEGQPEPSDKKTSSDELDALKRQMADMQDKISKLS